MGRVWGSCWSGSLRRFEPRASRRRCRNGAGQQGQCRRVRIARREGDFDPTFHLLDTDCDLHERTPDCLERGAAPVRAAGTWSRTRSVHLTKGAEDLRAEIGPEQSGSARPASRAAPRPLIRCHRVATDCIARPCGPRSRQAGVDKLDPIPIWLTLRKASQLEH